MNSLTLIQNRSLRAIEEDLFPGCVIGFIKNGQKNILPYGYFSKDTNAMMVEVESIYDVASITKSIPTACLALKMVEDKTISLDDKVIKYIPELSNSFREKILVRHLLSQGLDCGFRLSTYKNEPAETILQAIFHGEFNNHPGLKHFSTNTASVLLGLLIERVSGEHLEHLSQKIIFRPLNMIHTTFYPESLNNPIVPTQFDQWRGRIIQGEVHDETAYILRSKLIAGSAGLFSTARDLLIFSEMILNRGLYKNKRFFKSSTIDFMITNEFADPEPPASLGWDLYRPVYMGKYCHPSTFGKTGFTGCSFVCDLELQVSLIILSNYHYPDRKPSFDSLNKFRQDISDIIYK